MATYIATALPRQIVLATGAPAGVATISDSEAMILTAFITRMESLQAADLRRVWMTCALALACADPPAAMPPKMNTISTTEISTR